MQDKDSTNTEEQGLRRPEHMYGSDMRGLLSTLDRVFSTFREQLQTEEPKPFTGNAKIAVDTFNDIAAGLKFQSLRPRAITVEVTNVLPTEIELTWTDVPNNADGYRVERCQGCGCSDLDEIARLPSTARVFRDTNLSERTSYRYRIVAFNDRGATPSNIVDVTSLSSD
jgi:hypothetical protein